MAPRTSTVLRVRWMLRIALRLAAAGLVVVFVWRVVDRREVYWGDSSSFIEYGLLRNLSPLAGAISLFLLDLFSLRLLVPAGRWLCPRCGYDLENVSKPKCPECGQRLSGEVISSAAAEDGS